MDEQARRAKRVRRRMRRLIRAEKINIIKLDATTVIKIQALKDRLNYLETTAHDLQADVIGLQTDIGILEAKAAGFKTAIMDLDARVTELEHNQ